MTDGAGEDGDDGLKGDDGENDDDGVDADDSVDVADGVDVADYENADEGVDGEEGESNSEVVPSRAVLAESLAPIRDLLSRGCAVVGLPAPEVLAADVRSMGPHERFTDSAGRHAARLGIDAVDADSLAGLGADLPIEDPVVRATTFLARRAARLQGDLLGQLEHDPDRPRDYLLLAVAASHLQHAAIDLQVATTTDAAATADEDASLAADTEPATADVEHLASIALALSARFFDVVGDALDEPTDRDPDAAARDEPLADAVVLDVALADHHRERARGGTPSFDPVDRDVDTLRELQAVQGASLAVTELDADPTAVARLADVPVEHVLGILERTD